MRAVFPAGNKINYSILFGRIRCLVCYIHSQEIPYYVIIIIPYYVFSLKLRNK